MEITTEDKIGLGEVSPSTTLKVSSDAELRIIDNNPPIITETKDGNSLIKETTYAIPKVTREVTNIAEIQAKIDKYTIAKEQWESKIAPLQAIIDKFNKLK